MCKSLHPALLSGRRQWAGFPREIKSWNPATFREFQNLREGAWQVWAPRAGLHPRDVVGAGRPWGRSGVQGGFAGDLSCLGQGRHRD